MLPYNLPLQDTFFANQAQYPSLQFRSFAYIVCNDEILHPFQSRRDIHQSRMVK
jgi:hypothetical protein